VNKRKKNNAAEKRCVKTVTSNCHYTDKYKLFIQLSSINYTLHKKTRVQKNCQQVYCANLNNFALQQEVINGDRIFYETLTLRVEQFTRFAGERRFSEEQKNAEDTKLHLKGRRKRKRPELESSVKYQIM